MIIKSFKEVITISTSSFDESDRKKKHCHITTMDIKTINNVGQASNAPMTCMLIGGESNLKQRAVMIMSYFMGSIAMTIENTVVVLVVLAHGIRCMTMKSILNSKLMVTPTVISDSKFC